MGFDDRILPTIIFATFFVIILLIAFMSNFFPGEEVIINEDVVIKGGDITAIGRTTNMYYEDGTMISSIPVMRPYVTKNQTNDNKNSLDISSGLNNLENNHNIVYITGNIELNNNLNNDLLVQLNKDCIYTVTLSISSEIGLKINIWNNTNSIKNIKCNKNFIVNGAEKGKFITLKKQEVIILESTGISWKLISNSTIENNQQLIQKQIMSKIQNIIHINKLAIKNEIDLLKEKFVYYFNDDRLIFDELINNKIKEIENSFEKTLSTLDLSLIKTDEIDIFKSNIEIVKESLLKDIISNIYTENNDFISNFDSTYDKNRQDVLSEINIKIGNSIDEQIETILSKLVELIDPILNESIINYLSTNKEYLASTLETKLNKYELYVKNKIYLLDCELKEIVQNEVSLFHKLFNLKSRILKDKFIIEINNIIEKSISNLEILKIKKNYCEEEINIIKDDLLKRMLELRNLFI